MIWLQLECVKQRKHLMKERKNFLHIHSNVCLMKCIAKKEKN